MHTALRVRAKLGGVTYHVKSLEKPGGMREKQYL